MDQIALPGDDDAKKIRVLDSAINVFLSYGYRRVTMDDIARAADMSRPALYLIFKNKADIYRAIGQRLFETCASQVDIVMRGDEPLVERLDRALVDVMLAAMQSIMTAPHGAELLDLKNELAAGMIDDWRNAVSAAFRRAIEKETGATGVDLVKRGISATALADFLLDGAEAIKLRPDTLETKQAAIRQLARVIVQALRP